jgi:Xaa-Pro aminopeptidase
MFESTRAASQPLVIAALSADRAAGPDYQARRERAWRLAKEHDGALDALLCCDAHDIHYLTGVHEGIFWLAISESGTLGISRHMLIDEVRAAAPECEILLPSERFTSPVDQEKFLVEELVKRGLGCVGCVLGRLSVPVYLKLTGPLSAGGSFRLKEVPDGVGCLRAVKDGGEIALVRECVAIAEQALSELVQAGAGAWIGRSEREISAELEARMRALGADRQAFPGTGLIVGAGPNSASAHHQCGDTRIQPGDTVLVDWGAELHSYRSDMTRTFFIGSVPEYAQRAYPVVEQALLRAAAALRPGVLTHEIDRLAREAVVAAGYPEFYYGVGHGIGLDIHESPWLRINGADRLEQNMITTVEPGIYLPGIGGIRIENDYLITADGYECMGSMTTRLEEMLIC